MLTYIPTYSYTYLITYLYIYLLIYLLISKSEPPGSAQKNGFGNWLKQLYFLIKPLLKKAFFQSRKGGTFTEAWFQNKRSGLNP